ncbi:MAG: queuosine precursor transporter [Legionella sp.]|uniref:VUT family protein n=1 Tax=Legionella sp. TaxID=459 RepID=UPI003D108F52
MENQPRYIEHTNRNRNINQYNYLHFLMMLFITFFIVCDSTAFRMTVLFGSSVPVSGLIIPIVFALGDLIADVYGYQVSRKLIWNALICQFIFGIILTIAINFPSPEGNTNNIHYNLAFEHIIRTNITSCFSVSSGMFTNAFLMSKIKIWMNGKNFWVRTILSSSISEFVLCLVAYVILYGGLKELSEIWRIVLSVWYYKVIFAFIMAPFVSVLASFIKKKENVDFYDYGVNYNPFSYKFSWEGGVNKSI